MIRIGALVSGGGSNLQAIIDACKDGRIDGEVVAVISNNSRAYGLQRAKDQGIATYHLSSVTHPDEEELDKAMVEILKGHDVELVCLAGYMKKRGPTFIKAFANKVLNIHPALLPKYGGKGFYGRNVHRAVVEAREPRSGATVHLIDEQYDHGPILAQVEIDVKDEDTPDSLAARILIQEHMIYPKVVSMIASGEIDLDDFDTSKWTPIYLDPA